MAGTRDRAQSFTFGDYTITDTLGEGGMCRVFRARRREASEDCAIKLLREEHRDDPRMIDQFVTEADVSMMLSHPNLIRTLDVGEVQGRHYIAMELIEGASLRRVISRCLEGSILIPPDFSLYIITQVLQGLEAVHDAKSVTGRPLDLVHRDVTPHNVFLGFDGRITLGDFGIAQVKAYGDVELGGALGKIGYLSPEAACGEDVDRRSDLFAVAIILYELLTRSTLFDEGDDTKTLEAIAEARVPRPRRAKPSLSRTLEEEVLRGLARKPKDRFQGAWHMRLALEPHWSPVIGCAAGLAAFMVALFRDEAQAWRRSRS